MQEGTTFGKDVYVKAGSGRPRARGYTRTGASSISIIEFCILPHESGCRVWGVCLIRCNTVAEGCYNTNSEQIVSRRPIPIADGEARFHEMFALGHPRSRTRHVNVSRSSLSLDGRCALAHTCTSCVSLYCIRYEQGIPLPALTRVARARDWSRKQNKAVGVSYGRKTGHPT